VSVTIIVTGGWIGVMVLLASHAGHRDAGDDLALEDGVENQDGHRCDKCSGVRQPALDVASLLQHQQADG